MEETHSTAGAGLPAPERALTRIILIAAAAMVVIVAAGTAAVLFRPHRVVSGYEIEIPLGMSPRMAPTSVAGVAADYLDEQTPQLNEPSQHDEPRFVRVVAARAGDVRTIEPAVSAGNSQAAPERIVWVVFGSGDFLNLRDHEWSNRGDAYPMGTIVIDDATGAILGVFPHELP